MIVVTFKMYLMSPMRHVQSGTDHCGMANCQVVNHGVFQPKWL